MKKYLVLDSSGLYLTDGSKRQYMLGVDNQSNSFCDYQGKRCYLGVTKDGRYGLFEKNGRQINVARKSET